jgi:GNAT superfamily N-acetyltransferase
MISIDKREDVSKIIASIKHGSKDYITNFYPNDEKINFWINGNFLFSKNFGNTVFFFRKDRNFYHLYFCSKDSTTLKISLKDLFSQSTDIIVVDLVGSESNLPALVNMFEKIGFNKYVLYHRLVKFIQEDEVLPPVSKDVVFPNFKESKEISEMLENAFDKYAEQIPTADEIEIAIRNKEVTIVREDGIIAGLLIRNVANYSSLWRFFLVSEKHRAQGVGSKLLSYYFNECKGKKIISWVLDPNINSIKIHKHYAFRFDTLKDQIMVNKDTMIYEKNY